MTYLDPNQVPQHLRAGYTGKHFKAEARESYTVPADAGLWCEGSRQTYELVRMADGAQVDILDPMAAPWDESRKNVLIKLERSFCIRKHSIFLGKDMGITFIVHPNDIAPLLPKPIDVTEQERKVLYIYSAYISRARKDYCREAGLSEQTTAEIKGSLIAKGLMQKNGALTTAGKNAAQGSR